MRILYVCNEYPPTPHGGIGAFVHSLARHLAARGHGIIVAGFDPNVEKSSSQQVDGIRVDRIASPYRRMKGIRVARWQLNPAFVLERVFLSKRVDQLVAENDIQLVESYDWSGPLWTRPRVPLAVRLHGANAAHSVYENLRVSRLLRFVEKRNVEMADALVAVSNHIGGLTLKALGLEDKTFTTIYNGVDTELFHWNSLVREKDMILYAGSIHRRKGLAELFAAMARVFAYDSSVKLFLAGRIPEGGQAQKELLQLIPKSFQARVRFLGHVPREEMPRLYQRTTLAVFPSRAEAFGLACVEAMACGTPVVMTARASGPEIVDDGVSGLLANPDSPQEMAGLILSLLGDEKLRTRLAQGGRARVADKFDLAQTAAQNLGLYQSLL